MKTLTRIALIFMLALMPLMSWGQDSTSVPPYVPDSGLVAWFSFSGNAIDTVYDKVGTVHGATLADNRFGSPDECYHFDKGNSEYISVPADSLPLGNSPRTISYWVQFDSYPDSLYTGAWIDQKDPRGSIGYGENDNMKMFELFFWRKKSLINNDQDTLLAEDVLRLSLGGVGMTVDYSLGSPSDSTYELDTWYHVSCSYDGDSVRLYFNGEKVAHDHPGYLLTTNDSLYIGRSTTYVNFHMGKMDDIGIWNRAVPDSAINQLYVQGKMAPNRVKSVKKANTVTKVYPVPAYDKVNIEINTLPATLVVRNITGAVVDKRTITQRLTSVDVSNFAPGLYLGEVQTKSGVETVKIQVQ